ncbi:sulfite oxidase heme-binding subunit YedZ [Thiobacter aerophilum]|uniref:Protein-methionine-sulfoxide reductase heme-binding subunit MsrQ n=1 Tax=Thiobacter aerophilum TaxID=3121275 RepID=A0ABV0EGI9_9BURK
MGRASRTESVRRPRLAWLKPFLFLFALLPLARLVWLARGQGLGANPVEYVTHSTGTWALVWLLATLAVTPLRWLSGRNELVRLRRMLGLFAFFYASLHLLTYLWWDQFFDWNEIARDVIKRPFITAGASAYLLMLPLALTSTQAMMRQLGRHWQRLHRLVYGVGIAAVLHYFWLVKKDLSQPLLYGAILSLLLAARVMHWLRSK